MDFTHNMKKPMTKDEVALLVDLIKSKPILTSKETNATTNKSKDEAWISLARTFNSRSEYVPRSKKQLKFKWDNLKKAARKRAQQIRMKNLKTGGGKPDYTTLDEILEKVAGLLGSTCTGVDVVLRGDATGGDATGGDATGGDATGGDATSGDATDSDATDGDATDGDATGAGAKGLVLDVGGAAEVSDEHIINYMLIIDDDLSNDPEDLEVVAESPNCDIQEKDLSEGKHPIAETSKSSKYFFGTPKSKKLSANKKGKKKGTSVTERSIIARNLSVASYYDKKKEKLELEIKLLKLELANKIINM